LVLIEKDQLEKRYGAHPIPKLKAPLDKVKEKRFEINK